ncbi:MAG: TssQ family T6SS-associated lipoprotein [Burkholderiaceae bacterium]|nr:TssQ family T6SS-associated lipoprotein [Burkholderiaceae bacterium]
MTLPLATVPRPSRQSRLWPVLLVSALVAACATPAPPPPPPPPAPVGLAELMERPAERALVEGIRLYDNAQYPAAEAALQRALAAGLVSVRDQASAHKLIAFIACTSAREAECEAAFRAARAADPAFALSRAEAGHPMWGPVYRRVTGP